MKSIQVFSAVLKIKEARMQFIKCILCIAAAFIIPRYVSGVLSMLAAFGCLYFITDAARKFALYCQLVRGKE